MKEDSYPLLREVLESLVGAGHFSCLHLKSRLWQIKIDELSKQYTAFAIGNLGFFECDCMPFGLCNMPAMFQRLMQSCLRELNLTYCLIYLDDIIIFSQMTEEHLHWLCIIFDWFREHNLNLKPSKCNFSGTKSPTYPIESWRMGFTSVIQTWRPLQNAHYHKPIQRHMPSLVWWASTGSSSKELHALHSPLGSILLGKGPTGSWSGCHLARKPWRPLRH